MVRVYKKKTNREFPEGDIRKAVEDVINNVGSLRKVAELHNVKKSRLAIYVKKQRKMKFKIFHSSQTLKIDRYFLILWRKY